MESAESRRQRELAGRPAETYDEYVDAFTHRSRDAEDCAVRFSFCIMYCNRGVILVVETPKVR